MSKRNNWLVLPNQQIASFQTISKLACLDNWIVSLVSDFCVVYFRSLFISLFQISVQQLWNEHLVYAFHHGEKLSPCSVDLYKFTCWTLSMTIREYSNKKVKLYRALQVINCVTGQENTTFNNHFTPACWQVYIAGKSIVQ